MALIYCYECGKQISSLVSACPNCGAPRQNIGIEVESEQKDEGNNHPDHLVNSDGSEFWYANGILIHAKYSDGREEWSDPNGCRLHVRYPDGSEEFFDSMGRVTCIKNNKEELFFKNGRIDKKIYSDGEEASYEYGKSGCLNRVLCSNGIVEEYVGGKLNIRKFSDGREENYNESGQKINCIYSDGKIEYFDEKGHMIRCHFPDGHEEKYNEYGQRVSYLLPGGQEVFYNEGGQEIKRTFPDGKVAYYENGRMVRCHCPDGRTVFYDENGKESGYTRER